MKDFSNKLAQISILAFGLFPILPSDKRGVLIILLSLSSVIVLIVSKKLKWNKLLLINSALYLIYGLSLLYSLDEVDAFKRFETAFSLILIPVLFTLLGAANNSIFEERTQNLYYKLFIGSALIFSLIIFIYLGTLGYYSDFNTYEFCMSQLDRKLPILNDHPIYISISLSLAILFSMDVIKNRKDNDRNILIYVLGVVFLLFTLFFLSRKGVIGALLISLSALLIMSFKTNKKALRFGLMAIVFVAVLAILMPSNQKRFKELFKTETYTTKNETNSTNNRLQIYKCAITLVKNKPLLGYGIGKDRVALNKCYKDNLYYLFENNFNTHNQYLSIATKVGLIGLIIFLLFLFYNFKLALRTKDKMFLSILIFYSLVFLFENVLERQNGVILFAFLINYFAFKQNGNEKSLI